MSYENPAPAYGQPSQPKPDSNLVWGILATILCCLPLGIVSIVKAIVLTARALAAYQPARQIPIVDVTGMVSNQTVPGALVFEVNGESYRLDAIAAHISIQAHPLPPEHPHHNGAQDGANCQCRRCRAVPRRPPRGCRPLASARAAMIRAFRKEPSKR